MSDDDSGFPQGLLLGLLVGLVVGLAIGIIVRDVAAADGRPDAVARGCAEWRVDKDKVVTFHWLCGEDAK